MAAAAERHVRALFGRHAACSSAAEEASVDQGERAYRRETAKRSREAAEAAERLASDEGRVREEARDIERVHVSKLSLRAFREEVEAKQVPVVLTGLGEHLTEDGDKHADLQWLRRHAASRTVAVSTNHAHTASELRVKDYEMTTIGELLDGIDNGTAEGKYLYDNSIPLKTPSLLAAIRVPRYVAHDYLQRTLHLHAFSKSWPSLFVAAPGTQSSLHVDQWQGHFFMAMLRGTKRWTLFHRDDIHCLSPDWSRQTLDPALPPLDELDEDPQSYPLAQYARRWTTDLVAGEMLYVPAGFPHHVRNLDSTVGIAGNWADEVNIDDALFDLSIMAARQGKAMEDTFRAIDEVDFEDAGADEAPDERLPPEHLVVPYEHYAGGRAAEWPARPPDDALAALGLM